MSDTGDVLRPSYEAVDSAALVGGTSRDGGLVTSELNVGPFVARGSDNLMSDGDFEFASPEVQWTAGTGCAVATTATAASGVAALQISRTGAAGVLIATSTSVSIKPDRHYSIELAYAVNATLLAQFPLFTITMSIEVVYYDAGGTEIVSAVMPHPAEWAWPVAASIYQRSKFELNIAQDRASVGLRISTSGVGANTGAAVLLDDIRIREIPFVQAEAMRVGPNDDVGHLVVHRHHLDAKETMLAHRPLRVNDQTYAQAGPGIFAASSPVPPLVATSDNATWNIAGPQVPWPALSRYNVEDESKYLHWQQAWGQFTADGAGDVFLMMNSGVSQVLGVWVTEMPLLGAVGPYHFIWMDGATSGSIITVRLYDTAGAAVPGGDVRLTALVLGVV